MGVFNINLLNYESHPESNDFLITNNAKLFFSSTLYLTTNMYY